MGDYEASVELEKDIQLLNQVCWNREAIKTSRMAHACFNLSNSLRLSPFIDILEIVCFFLFVLMYMMYMFIFAIVIWSAHFFYEV